MKVKYRLIPAALALCLGLTSCALVPEEEAVRTAPVVKEYNKEVHKFAEVQRGDLAVTEKITCRYEPVRMETLSFALGGEVVDKVLVQTGDVVEEGQILAQLELNGLDEDIARAETDIEAYKLRISAAEKQHDILRRRGEVEWADLTASARMQASEALEAELELEMRALEDALEVAQMRLEVLRTELDQRQIRAPFSGTLTYVRDYAKGELSEFGTRAMVLVDSALSLFRVETMNWTVFKPGDVYETTVNRKDYVITVADEEALGIKVKEKTPGKMASVYFTLEESDFTLSEGDYGSIEVVHEYREDTLHLPVEAIKRIDDREVVFYLDENGLRAYKDVVTGIRNGKRVEILSGLSEGDRIIID